MDLIDIDRPQHESRNGRIVARSVGTSFDVRAADSGVTEIDLYDEIGGWGITASDFRSRLKDASGDITLRINSPGGNVFDGIAIYNDLVEHKGRVRVEIPGVAALIASIIAMAGDEIVMAENAFMMIHNAWTITIGNRHDLIDLAGVLGKIDEAMSRTYAAKAKAGIRSIKQMMDDETWMTGAEAKEMGFATATYKAGETAAKAQFDLSVFSHVPDGLTFRAGDGNTKTIRDAEKALREAGWSRANARKVLTARDDDLRDADRKTTQRDAEVKASIDRLCAAINGVKF